MAKNIFELTLQLLHLFELLMKFVLAPVGV